MKKWWPVVFVLLVAVAGVVLFFRTDKKNNQPAAENSAENTETPTVVSPEIFKNDKDRDGISDADEEKNGLSNTQFDTDGDGLTDFDEINKWKTDPKKMDSDGDKFADGWEVMSGFDPAGPGKLETK